MVPNLERSMDVLATPELTIADEWCPTCGNPLTAVNPKLLRRSGGRPWWPMVLLALAAYLIASFGVALPVDYQNAQGALAYLRETEGLGQGVVPDPKHFTVQLEVYISTAHQLNRDLTAMAIGMLATLLGISRLLRGLGEPTIAQVSSPRNRTAHRTVSSWSAVIAASGTLAETLGLAFLWLLLAGFCSFAAPLVFQSGLGPAQVVAEATNRTLDVVIAALQLL